MSKLKDAEIRNLRQRLDKAVSEAKRWKRKAEEADYLLGLADAQLQFLHQMMPEQVRRNDWVM